MLACNTVLRHCSRHQPGSARVSQGQPARCPSGGDARLSLQRLRSSHVRALSPQALSPWAPGFQGAGARISCDGTTGSLLALLKGAAAPSFTQSPTPSSLPSVHYRTQPDIPGVRGRLCSCTRALPRPLAPAAPLPASSAAHCHAAHVPTRSRCRGPACILFPSTRGRSFKRYKQRSSPGDKQGQASSCVNLCLLPA